MLIDHRVPAAEQPSDNDGTQCLRSMDSVKL